MNCGLQFTSTTFPGSALTIPLNGFAVRTAFRIT